MNVLVTGAGGFIGRNLVEALRAAREGADPDGGTVILAYTRRSAPGDLEAYCAQADFVFHLAGVLRPKSDAAFQTDNLDLTERLLESLKSRADACPVMLASSIQAAQDNPYGESKRRCEEMVFQYGEQTGARTLVYRFTNTFGKWSRPNYTSVVATFCYNIARDLPIQISDPARELRLCYIDDLTAELLRALRGQETRRGRFCEVPAAYPVTLGRLAELIRKFREQPESVVLSEFPEDSFERKLYSTYITYLPEKDGDNRGYAGR